MKMNVYNRSLVANFLHFSHAYLERNHPTITRMRKLGNTDQQGKFVIKILGQK